MTKPKSQRLPGTGGAIAKLEELAEEYRDLGQQRKAAKAALIAEMEKRGKVHYSHKGINITITEGAKGVRVSITEEEEEAA